MTISNRTLMMRGKSRSERSPLASSIRMSFLSCYNARAIEWFWLPLPVFSRIRIRRLPERCLYKPFCRSVRRFDRRSVRQSAQLTFSLFAFFSGDASVSVSSLSLEPASFFVCHRRIFEPRQRTMGQHQVILRHQKFTFPRARE